MKNKLFVCINDVFSNQWKQVFKELPKKDEIYTLRSVIQNPRGGTVGYLFEELHNPLDPDGIEYNFRQSRFVPLNTIKDKKLELAKEYA